MNDTPKDIIKRKPFPKSSIARERLMERADEILEAYLAVIAEARQAGDFKTASTALQWLIDHMPRDNGGPIIDTPASKPKVEEGSKGPSIQIGIALGGVTPKALPEPIIDITPLDED